MSAMRRFVWMPAAVILVSGLAGAAAGCAGSGSGSAGGASGGGGVAVHPSASDGLGAAPSQDLGLLSPEKSSTPARSVASGTKLGANPLKSLPALRSAVIKTGDVRLRVDHGHFGQTVRAVRHIAQRFGGYQSRSSTSGSQIHSGRITIRVPARSFGAALDALESIAHVRVTAESSQGQDVSQQFVDLQARLVNLQAQEKVLLRLMDRAQTISESIQVENYLQNVEFQLEDIQGRMLYLQNRTSMSTISLELQEAGRAPAPPQHASALWKAGERSLGAALDVVTSVIVGAGVVIPVGILALLALVAVRRLAPLTPALRLRGAGEAPPSADG